MQPQEAQESGSNYWKLRAHIPPPNPSLFDHGPSQADPITPLVGAKKTANVLDDNAFLIGQLGFGHSSVVQVSSCTFAIVNSYIVNSAVGVVFQCTLTSRSR
jgi:hypothetical protein